MLVVACNSIEVAAIADVANAHGIPVAGVIEPGVRAAIRATRNHRVGMIATEATVASGAYDRAVDELHADVRLRSTACPEFVDFVERGDTSSPELLGIARGYLEPLRDEGVDTLILGCTHYPMLSGLIQLVMGEDVVLVSSAEETAKDVYATLLSSNLLRGAGRRARARFLRPAIPRRSTELAHHFLGPAARRRRLGRGRPDRGLGVKITVLGASGSWPDRGTALSGYLIEEDGFSLWLDCGSGTMANLQKHIGIGDVDAMLITHEHADHCVDVYPLFYARYYNRQGADGMPLYIPKGLDARMMALLSEESIEGFHIGFDVHETVGDEEFEVGPFRVRAHQMEHLGLPALGYRIASDGVALAYTGDTGPAPSVVALARDADVFLAEATYQDADELFPFHLSARQAAEIARDAGAGELVLTHLLPSRDPAVSRSPRPGRGSTAQIAAAVEGLVMLLGNDRDGGASSR